MKREEQTLRPRLMDACRRAARDWRPQCTRFLALEERDLARACARETGVEAAFDGGWPEAERAQCCFFPEGVEPIFTGEWVEAKWNARFGTVDHRALLGSVMALGMERAMMGDIVLEGERAYLRVMPELAARLPLELTRAGNTPICVKALDTPPLLQPPKGKEVRDTVASLRLDCVLASGLRTSRTRAAEWIHQGLTQVNHQLTERTDLPLKPGDLISVRGFGRMRLVETGAPTRKDRIPILLESFGKQ